MIYLRLFRQHTGRPGRAGYLLQDRAGVYRQPQLHPLRRAGRPGRNGPRDRVHRRASWACSPPRSSTPPAPARPTTWPSRASPRHHGTSASMSSPPSWSTPRWAAALSALQRARLRDRPAERRTATAKQTLPSCAELLRPDTVLVAVCAVDSELGTVQPVKRDCRDRASGTRTAACTWMPPRLSGKTDLWFDGVDTHELCRRTNSAAPTAAARCTSGRGLVIEPQISGGASTTHLPQRHARAGPAASPRWKLSADESPGGQPAASPTYQRLHDRACSRTSRRTPRCASTARTGAVPHILNLSVNGVKGHPFSAGPQSSRASASRSNPPARRTACRPRPCLPSAATAATRCPRGASA